MGPATANPADFSPGGKVSFQEAWRFITRVGVAAHGYGCPAPRLAAVLVDLSQRLGYPGVFRSTPSEILFALRESPESPQRVEVIAMPAPGADLDKLARLGDLLNEVGAGRQALADASARVDAIDRAPQPWGSFASMMGYVLVGLGLAPILGGGWADTLCATLFSVLVYGLVAWSGRLGAVATAWVPFSTALVVGALATVVKLWIPELNLVLVVLSAVAIILPGYTISLGVGELVAQHVVSGTENLVSGLICLAKQIAGGWLGIVAAASIVPVVAAGPASPVRALWVQLLFPLLLVGLALAFQTARRDLPWAVLVSGLAYLGIMAGSSILDSNLGNLVGTVIAVVAAHLWSRRTARPSSIVLIPAIVMLVSGSIGFRGLASMAGGQVLLGAQQFLQMFVVAMTILVGISIGKIIVRPAPGL
ncbi:MAG TPA: threonine/serine exporter family protein [Gemmatimonadales bacterium]|nr:threonine/serine exporter family protein [Gemmatimonadales bacterium]